MGTLLHSVSTVHLERSNVQAFSTPSLSFKNRALFFKAVSGCKIEQKVQKVQSSYMLPAPTCVQPCPLSIISIGVAQLLKSMNPYWHISITQSPKFLLVLTLGVFILWVWANIWWPVFRILKSSFTALKVLCALPLHPSLPLSPDNYWSFYCLQSFAFSRKACNWNHTVCSLLRTLQLLTNNFQSELGPKYMLSPQLTLV